MQVSYLGEMVGTHIYTTLDGWIGARDLKSGCVHEFPAEFCQFS